MKYVKRISLFFVYPLGCFVLGWFIGTYTAENQQPEFVENNEEIEQYTNIVSAPSTNEGYHVMNPSAIAETRQEYYVTFLDNYVVVYQDNRETVFLFTDIKAEELPEDVQTDLKNGIYMSGEGELYDFLENYTS